MKTWMKILLGLIAAFALLFAIIFYVTSGITDTADRFFSAARAGDMTSAYALTSKSLQKDNSAEETMQFIKAYDLDKVVHTSWATRSIESSVGTLEGTATTDDDAVIPLTIRLVKEAGSWRINGIEAERAGMRSRDGNAATETPSLATQTRVAHLMTNHFVESLDDHDFSSFLEYWVKDMTLGKLENAFGQIREQKDLVKPLQDAQPTIEDARVLNNRGTLEIKGHYDIASGRYNFDYKLVPYGSDWKIASFEIEQK